MTASLSWFRLYSEIVDDEKLRLLAFEDRWHFVALLCCKAAGIVDEGGALLRRKVAVKCGLDIASFEEVARRLSEVELIDFDTLQPRAWERRQHKSDTSTERVREHRERMKRYGNVSVTPPETEAETETETETEKTLSERERHNSGVKASTQARSPTGSRLPDEFPTDEDVAWCEQERPDLDTKFVREKFRDYWLGVPGAKGRKVDWPATWRNFVRSELAPRAPPARASPRRSAAVEAGLALAGFTRHPQPETIDVVATAVPAARLG